MANPASRDEFCLYLWRSLDTPGTLYLARNIEHAQAVYAGLVAEGYIVKAVQVATNIEYTLYDGELLPATVEVGGSDLVKATQGRR